MLDDLGFSWELPSEMKRRLKSEESINSKINEPDSNSSPENNYNNPGPKATPYRLNDDGSSTNDSSSNGSNDSSGRVVSSSNENKKNKTSDFMRKWELNLVRIVLYDNFLHLSILSLHQHHISDHLSLL